MLMDLVVVILAVVVLRIVWRFVGGLIRLLLVAAVIAFAVFYFAQPAVGSPTHRAQIAAHHVIAHGDALAHRIMPRWRVWLQDVQAMIHYQQHPHGH